MLLKQNAPRKERWRFFLVEAVAVFLLQKSPFEQALHRTATNSMVEGDFTTVKNRTIEIDITRNMVFIIIIIIINNLFKVDDKKIYNQ